MDVAALQSLVSSATVGSISNNARVQSGTDTTSTQTGMTKDVSTSKLTEIASRYDIRNITPRQIIAMAKELYDNGSISLLEAGSMELHYYKPADYIPGEFHTGVIERPDEPRDMLADFKDMSSYQRTPEATKNAQTLVDDLELVESLHKKSSFSKSTANTQSAVEQQAAALSYAKGISASTVDTEKIVKILEGLNSHKQDDTLTSDISSASYDIHNMSPHELANTTQRMAANGEISLKEQLLFSLVDREKSLSKLLGRDVHVQAWSGVFDNPDTKRDMMVEYKAMLQGQSGATSDLTRDAIVLLEKMSKKNSFGQRLANHT